MDPLKFSKLCTMLFRDNCSVLENKILDSAIQVEYKIGRKQKYIIHHEVAAFMIYFDSLILRFLSSNTLFDDDSVTECTKRILLLGKEYGYSIKRPFFSSLPKSGSYLMNRFLDYDNCAFNDKYNSQHLLTYLSDEQASLLSDLPLNQIVAVFCEIVSRTIIERREMPIDYNNEIKIICLSGLISSNVISAYSYLIHCLTDSFINIILTRVIESEADRSELYQTPDFSTNF